MRPVNICDMGLWERRRSVLMLMVENRGHMSQVRDDRNMHEDIEPPCCDLINRDAIFQ